MKNCILFFFLFLPAFLAPQAKIKRDKARQALFELEKQSTLVVENLLKDAEKDVYHLSYVEALRKLNAAADIGQKKTEVASALLEIAFFYSESGSFLDANEIISTASKLRNQDFKAIHVEINNISATRREFRQCLQNLDPVRFAELEARYYPVMIAVKGGEFIMGCKEINCNKFPQVKLSDFNLARTETTFWQFALYTAAARLKIQGFSPEWGLDGDNPVVNVSWYQALQYANWASTQQNLQLACNMDSTQIIPNANGFRLPTEAEWEYAARGGIRHDTYLYSGSDDLAAVAWYNKNADTLGVRRTHPVSTRLPNGLNLSDMSGNAQEWCWDYYDYLQSGVFENPTGPTSGQYRVLRGGSWYFGYVDCRVAFRLRSGGNDGIDDLGFRLARH